VNTTPPKSSPRGWTRPELTTRRRLDQPRRHASRFTLDIDPDTFGRFSEKLARALGTGKYLFWQTVIVVVWIAINVFAVVYRWDPYPFILLNLAFSTQAAYAAPLILLAQNRQDDRDRVSLEEDRNRAAQTKADTEYLARELAALRLAVGEVVTRDYLRSELDKLREDLNTKPRKAKSKAKSNSSEADRAEADQAEADLAGHVVDSGGTTCP
jgi:uncharacterized membrane protein